MNEQRTVSHPVFIQPRDADQGISRGQMSDALATASREQAELEASYRRAMNGPPRHSIQQEPPRLRAPELAEDFVQQVTALDEKIFDRGVGFSRERLDSLGREQFQKLLAFDHEARTEQRAIDTGVDLSSWTSVQRRVLAVHNLLAQVPVPRRKISEEYAGINSETDEVRGVAGFNDLWKAAGAEPRAIRAIHVFRACFESLAFGHSLLERISADGRLRSRFFCGGAGSRSAVFADWLSALEGKHWRVTLNNSLQSVVCWLADETSLPDTLALARDWTALRCPNEKQIATTQAVLDGFFLNYKDWHFWQYVGRRTRTLPDRYAIKVWREQLHKQFPKVAAFHRDLEAGFYKPTGNHYRFDSQAHRSFVDQTLSDLQNCVSGAMALTVTENSSAAIVARFSDWLLFEPKKAKPNGSLAKNIETKLATVFPNAKFQVQLTEVNNENSNS